jgi:diacylglycerol kinase family enzyme
MSAMRRVIVLLNAGSGSAGAGPHAVADAFARHRVDAEIRVPAEGRLEEEAHRAARAEADCVVAAGGDGTVSAVAHALAPVRGTLGVLPLGTLNHFAKDLGLPLELEAAVAVIAGGETIEVDLGEVNGRFFVNNSSLGLYVELVRNRDERLRHRRRRKAIATLAAALAMFRRAPLVEVEIEAEGVSTRRRTAFVFVGNNVYELQLFSIGARKTLSGGALCLYTPRRTGRAGLLALALRTITGTLEQARDFDALELREATIRTRRQRARVSLDGEVLELGPELRYRIRPRALRVLVPKGGREGAAR